jgi:hypothetical protein
MRQLGCKSADVYCQITNNDFYATSTLFILKQKEGEKGKLPERQRECVCEKWRVAENGVGICRKTVVGRRINYFGISDNSNMGITFS